MEIPTAVIHRLQSSLRGAAAAPSFPDSAVPAPPIPCIADAVAAFDAGASTSSELRCGRCGSAGGLLRGAQSAVCAYCGSPRRGEGVECEGGGIAFRDGPAYRWLLGSLGLDGSEPVEFDNETTGSKKSKEAPKSGMVISDLLDLKLTCIPENKGTSASSISEEQPSAMHSPNLTGVSVDSFFTQGKETTPAVTIFPKTHTVVQENSRSEMHVTSTRLMTPQRTNQVEATPAFANWDAEFQSASTVSAPTESTQLDLFKSASASESFSFPADTAINPIVGAGNEANVKSANLEHSEGLALVDSTLVKDNLFKQKVEHPILESSRGITPENTVPDLKSSHNKNPLKHYELQQRDDTGVNDDDAFDDWQEFTGGENQGSLLNAGESEEEHLRRDPSKIKTIDPWPLGSMESPNDVKGDPSDDWQAFATSSGQEGQDSVKPMEGSTGTQECGSVRLKLVEESTSNTLLEHSSQDTSVDLWPIGNVDEHSTAEIVQEANDSFDDWQDFTVSGQVQNTSFSQTGNMMETIGQKEINLDSWFMGDSTEAKYTDSGNGNIAILNDWQGLTGSDQSHQNSSKNHSLEHNEATDSMWVNDSNMVAANTSSANMDTDSFDIWQDFAKSGQVTVASTESAKETDAMDFWLISNVKESNNREDVRRIDDSSDGWQDFASFGQVGESTKIPEEGHLVKDPLGAETLNLWASSNAAGTKVEDLSGNNDLFDDWQDFKNSGETSLQVFSDASSLDKPKASKPDAVVNLEFGTISELVSSQNQKDENEDSRIAKATPYDEDTKSANGMQQMSGVGSLSAIWPTKDAISGPEPADANVGKLLSQMHDLSFMLKDELSLPDKPVDHSKS